MPNQTQSLEFHNSRLESSSRLESLLETLLHLSPRERQKDVLDFHIFFPFSGLLNNDTSKTEISGCEFGKKIKADKIVVFRSSHTDFLVVIRCADVSSFNQKTMMSFSSSSHLVVLFSPAPNGFKFFSRSQSFDDGYYFQETKIQKEMPPVLMWIRNSLSSCQVPLKLWNCFSCSGLIKFRYPKSIPATPAISQT